MPGRLAEAVVVSALATTITMVMAAPVLRAPSDRVFGMEIVGRHHDPFTVMAQFGRPISVNMYSQPVTDITGALLSRASGKVAAYNWLVLLSFPLSAAAAYLLARYLGLSSGGATVAALAYAFSPFHVAQAAYHAHIAQTQWIPLYFLALWHSLDDGSPLAVAFLGAATLAVTLSNFYGGLIAAVITPVAVAAYWKVKEVRDFRNVFVTVASLGLMAAAGLVYASHVAQAVVVNPAAFAFPRADLFRYSANWWSYLVPPVEHPLLGTISRRLWSAAGVREGLLEQQVSLGWGIVTLGLIAIFRWPAKIVPVLVIVAAAALACSLSPDWTIGAFTFIRPAALLYDIAPMFRAYARFGVVVQLMAALLAGIGVDFLLRAGTRKAQIACITLVAVAAGEYIVAPWAQWRNVLPTSAHRWVMQQTGRVKVLDCVADTQETTSVQWLTGDRVTLLGGSTGNCTDGDLPGKLAAIGYTHLLVRRDTSDGQWFADHPSQAGLRIAANFDDGQVFAVTAPAPAVYTATTMGFFPREHDAERSWRWIGADATWIIVNTHARPIVAVVGIEMSAFHHARQMEVSLDGHSVQTLVVQPSRRIYRIGPLTVPPGGHQVLFHPAEAPTVASDLIHNGDQRQLSFALGTWNWSVQGQQP